MDTLHKPEYDSKYAAVTFGTTATVNFNFLPYSSAASKLTRIPYPDGSTNTQAGLAEAKKLFDDPNSGTLFIRIWAVKTYACIVQSLNTDGARDRNLLTISRTRYYGQNPDPGESYRFFWKWLLL